MNKHNKNILDKYKKYNINIDINYRFQKNTEHDSKSLLLMDHLKTLDFELNGDCIRFSTSINNNQRLVYLLDCYFELEEAIQDEIEEIYIRSSDGQCGL